MTTLLGARVKADCLEKSVHFFSVALHFQSAKISCIAVILVQFIYYYL